MTSLFKITIFFSLGIRLKIVYNFTENIGKQSKCEPPNKIRVEYALFLCNKMEVRRRMQTEFDTIAAISTAPGEGAIGIVRISGEEAISIADSVYRLKEKRLVEQPSHTIHYGHIVDPDSHEVIDEVMVTVLRAPKTFTREDVVEINCHGGIVAINRILQLVLRMGARLAEPGEFTKRAFLNGRIDLSQAEAVMDLCENR